ncbi:MAG: hypothetical protein KAT17_06000 [Candidatus Aminicenantes bacterium]|nr:hypothetical protein [Candidatus Aminicenantes bacterium]
MREKEKQILFHMVICIPDTDRETQYTIFDKDPSFSSLTRKEQRQFIKFQQQKIIELITRSYQPHSQNISNKG